MKIPFTALAVAIAVALTACSGAKNTEIDNQAGAPVIASAEGLKGIAPSTMGMSGTPIVLENRITSDNASRLLTQATFGITSVQEIMTVREFGVQAWLDKQFSLPAPSYLDYLVQQAPRSSNAKPSEEMAYEAIWQHWLYSPAQLRARTSFALSEIFVISNVAPDLNPMAMASYMEMLNRNGFGNYRGLLEQVTLHPAMGYYLNMIESEKENPDKGTHPNENYAREVLQLFSIGLVQLNLDGTVKKDVDGKPIPTFNEEVVKGFAKAFSGWSYGGRDTADANSFQNGQENWTIPMQAWASKHSTASKQLLDNVVISAGQTPQYDMQVALDNIANHPNVAPFISRRLIQRFVTSNPTPSFIQRVATVFNNNGSGVRGDLRAVITAILTDAEARNPSASGAVLFGKQREPVIRFANFLRALNAMAASGHNEIHYLDSADNALGQSPLLSPSVFNFFSPDFKSPGEIAVAGLNAPEFQATTETSMVGGLNFFAKLFRDGGYGSNENQLKLDFSLFDDVAGDASQLIDRIDTLFANQSLSPATRSAMMRAINSIDAKSKTERIRTALILISIAPEFVIQK
jgi:uncharacterized protein (DUF1800 family)